MGQEVLIRQMFSGIAAHYDAMNTLMSFGLDGRWRRQLVQEAKVRPGDRVLDVGCGTAVLSLEAARAVGAEGQVVGMDFCREMLEVGRANLARRPEGQRVTLTEGNALSLPFADDYFSVVLSAFVIRNLDERERALAEMYRVMRPGGRLAILELARPGRLVFRFVFRQYFHHVVPWVGRCVIGKWGPYNYLPESVDNFPEPQAISHLIQRTGFIDVAYREVSWGTATIYHGSKGGDDGETD